MSLLELTTKALRDADVTHIVTVANLETAALYEQFRAEPDLTVIDTCREGEAVAIASGLNLGGRRACLSMENFGLFECLDTLRALPYDMQIGIPVFVGYTGRGATPDQIEPYVGNINTQVVAAGEWTEPVLKATGIEYELLLEENGDEANRAIMASALAAGRPFALLVDTFDEGA